jgi:MFS family permease
VKIFAGYLLDRFSFRLILQSGLFISFIGIWGMYNIHSSWALIASSAIFGMGVSPVWLLCYGSVNEANRAEQMGLLYSLWLTGLGLGPVVINFLIDKSYLISFWFITCLWLIGGVLSLRVNSTKHYKLAHIPLNKQIDMLWSRIRIMGPLFPGMILQTMAASMLVPILPDFATKHLGLSHADYSYLLIVGGVSTIIFLVPMGRLSDRWGGKWFMICGFGTFAFALYSLTLVSSFDTTIEFTIILGLSYAAVLPAWNALLANFVPKEQQGLGWGLFSSLEGLGIILGPVIGGWLAVQYNDAMTFTVSGLLFICISLLYFVFPTSIFRKEVSANK